MPQGKSVCEHKARQGVQKLSVCGIDTPRARGGSTHKAKLSRDSKIARIHLNPAAKGIGKMPRREIMGFKKPLGLCYIIADFLGCEAIKDRVCVRVVADGGEWVFGDIGYILPAQCEKIVCAGVVSDTEFLANV